MGKPAKYIGILVLSCMTSSLSYGDDLLSILQLALKNDLRCGRPKPAIVRIVKA